MPDSENTSDWVKRSVALDGVLHLRPAHRFSVQANSYDSEIRVGDGTTEVDGKSIMELLVLGGNRGRDTEVCIRARGSDAVEAVVSLQAVLAESIANTRPDEEH